MFANCNKKNTIVIYYYKSSEGHHIYGDLFSLLKKILLCLILSKNKFDLKSISLKFFFCYFFSKFEKIFRAKIIILTPKNYPRFKLKKK
ncbi:hypothetical protein EGI24_17140 [Lacihabitans sp. CS3-21]|nr:hypothetical protein [Lacihabitans sp. CS3-21]